MDCLIEKADKVAKSSALEKDFEAKVEKFNREIDEARAEALADTTQLLDQTRRETEKLVSDIRKSQADEKQVKKLHRTVSERKRSAEKKQSKITRRSQPRHEPAVFGVGDRVRIISLDQEGEIAEMIGNQKARVAIGQVNMTVELRNLELLDQPVVAAKKKSIPMTATDDSGLSPEIHLRGMTVEEALENLDKYIDRAVLSSLTQIYVIHGKGTGTLRRKLTDYLKAHREVDSLRIGNWNEGGAGVTIVKLKK